MKKIFKNPLLAIIILAFAARLLYTFTMPDLKNDYYWEHGDIAKFLLDGKGYSFYFVENDTLKWGYQNHTYAYPSAYMPPGYVYFLYPFLMIKNLILRNILFYTIQNLLSLICIYFLYKFAEREFSKKTAIISACIYGFLPEFIYTSHSIGPTITYHLGVILIFYLIYKKNIFNNLNLIGVVSVISIISIYFRTEFAVFAVIIFLYILLKKKIKHAVVFASIILIMLTPWIIRNYIVFQEFIPLTTNSGYNFYKGHGDSITIPKSIVNKIIRYKNESTFEQKANHILFDEGINYIKAHPLNEFVEGLERVAYLWFISPHDPRSYNPIYLIPWILLLILSIVGIIKTWEPKRFLLIYLFFAYHSLMVYLFYTLPRYQVLMKVMLIPFAAYGIVYFINSKRQIKEE